MGFVKSWINKKIENYKRGNARCGGYGRIVAFVEKKYGAIDETDPLYDVKDKFERALTDAISAKGENYVVGLSKYVQSQKYKYLIREESITTP